MSEQEKVLLAFWVRFRKGEPILDLMREYSHYRFEGYHGRAAFNRSGIAWKRRCLACHGSPNHRHHIIQLSRGGMNISANIVTLCRICHREVHRPGARKWKTGILNVPRFLGPPRLVKTAPPAVTEGSAA